MSNAGQSVPAAAEGDSMALAKGVVTAPSELGARPGRPAMDGRGYDVRSPPSRAEADGEADTAEPCLAAGFADLLHRSFSPGLFSAHQGRLDCDAHSVHGCRQR